MLPINSSGIGLVQSSSATVRFSRIGSGSSDPPRFQSFGSVVGLPSLSTTSMAVVSAVGAVGFLEKQTSADVLTKAIREVAAGKAYFSPAIAKRIVEARKRSQDRDGLAKPNAVRLTSRETEVLQLVAEGQANKQVAATLGISIKTVEKHRQHVMDKLNIHETAGLTRYAIAHGIIESSVQVTIV